MNLRTALLLLVLPGISPLLAQEEIMITSEPVVVPEQTPDPEEPLTFVEEMPSFPGGPEAMFKYIGKELKYPEEAVEQGIEGAVYIAFVVERDGSVSDVKVLRGIGGGCSEEAVRVVQRMPKWTPGKQNGKLVRVRYTLPIRYKLQEPKVPKE
jgi:protein TonB